MNLPPFFNQHLFMLYNQQQRVARVLARHTYDLTNRRRHTAVVQPDDNQAALVDMHVRGAVVVWVYHYSEPVLFEYLRHNANLT
jgi:hypothetical protein